MLGGVVGVFRFWLAMRAADEAAGGYKPKLGIAASLIRVVTTLLRHDKFDKCQDRASRRLAHLGAFYGFVALFLVSVWAVVALYMINPLGVVHLDYPFRQWNPWKILANAGCVALVAGCIVAIRDRITNKKDAGASTSFDWIFVWLLLSVGITGLLTEVLRLVAEPVPASGLTGLQYTAYTVYFVHLVVVFQLLVYLPYSKFAHVLYRTVALVYAERTGRNAGEVE
jgi:quinone-modifying oxidoreductase, subunit QmoC